MKSRDIKALHEKSAEELKKLLGETRIARNAAALELAQMKAKNTKTLNNIRKEIAQILTILKEKDLSADRQG